MAAGAASAASTVFGLNGHSLSAAELTALQCSFVALETQYKGSVQFWGKIFGTQADYFIAQVHDSDPLATRKTLYSTDGGLHWHLLDLVSEAQVAYCLQLGDGGPFVGDPSFEYKIKEKVDPAEFAEPEVPPPPEPEEEAAPKDDDEEADEEDEEREPEETEKPPEAPPKKKKPPPYRIISIPESVRLAFTIADIDWNCRIVPRGAYLKSPKNDVVANPTFFGLSRHDSGKLSSYFHLRPYDIAEEALLQTEQMTPSLHFLEPISADIPQGVWSLRLDASTNLVVASNLLYPGYTFYSRPEAKEHGQYYFGFGERNHDLCFML
eukprot:NODE_2339_length_1144_cov_67.395434_g1944_i0.p1 GENE.NODE_2339_length_1144_cov_67.395434_g1944_i0~~NODE_2339_length_1144_cov_67.395434_g1944_i0.p1  ORF type:complete len:323 (+),score=102.08 NODE_2339_length_1144_cov_67.395434_g1944_i0:75-1043(+)